MKMVSINFDPTEKMLRQFGWICAFFLPLLAWAFTGRPRPWNSAAADWKWVGIFLIIGIAIALIGMAFPKFIKPIFVGLSIVTFPIGLVLSEVILFLFFFVVFLPFGLVFKLIGRDAMERRFEPAKATYWVAKRQPANVRQYFRQF